ncbi:MAG: hypothetical protein KAI66_27840, partial [Lentisphaeria bacterium]|nr:hypothetical protein [Lentisphaeria bacterium]
AGPQGFHGGLSNRNYCRIAKVAPATAARDLADLVTRGFLRRHGAGRATRYDLRWELASEVRSKIPGSALTPKIDRRIESNRQT